MTGSGGAGGSQRQPVRTIAAAVEAFLARSDLATSSRRSYAQTLNRLAADIGADSALAMLDADALDGAMQRTWRGARCRLTPTGGTAPDPR